MARRHYTRVAVAQLSFRPAVLTKRRSPLETPFYELERHGEPDPLAAALVKLPKPFFETVRAAQLRIRGAYLRQLELRLFAIVDACSRWGVKLLVLPEYSVPWDLLERLALRDPRLVIVAGTHSVEKAALEARIYEKLGWKDAPVAAQAVAPVIVQGRIIALQPKLEATHFEDQLVTGDRWAPIALEAPLPGPMGVMICLDFMHRGGEKHRAHVAERLDECRFVAVPSLTPAHTVAEFAAQSWVDALRYKRPVLYADGASGGGSTVFVDEGRAEDLRDYPEHVGVLGKGEEGLIVADVDLGYERGGRARPYADQRPVVPVAAASLVYRSRRVEETYAAWLAELAGELEGEACEVARVIERVIAAEPMLLEAGAMRDAALRDLRLKRVIREADGITSAEQCRQFLREVVLEPDVLPMPAVGDVLARAMAEVLAPLSREEGGAGLGVLAEQLRERARKATAPDRGEWSEGGIAAIGRLLESVRVVEPQRESAVEVRERFPAGADLGLLGERSAGGFKFYFAGWIMRSLLTEEDRERARERPGFIPRETWMELSESIRLLALAEGADQAGAVVVHGGQIDPQALVLSRRGDRWRLSGVKERAFGPRERELIEALRSVGFLELEPAIELFDLALVQARVEKLRAAFDGARGAIARLREERLTDVSGSFVALDVAERGSSERADAIATLDAWFDGDRGDACLLLGEFGRGKSTVLAEWAHRRWTREKARRPLLVHLAAVSPVDDPELQLLMSAGLEDSPRNRARLELVVRYGHFVPCFDGFDEMATRVTSAELPARLGALVRTAAIRGKVLISSRSHYFKSDSEVSTTLEQALANALGGGAKVLWLDLQPLTAEQIRALVAGVKKDAVEEALARIRDIYPLTDLADRPLLLGMVLRTLDDLHPGAKITQADLYEAYLARWLAQTHGGDREVFTDGEKAQLAEIAAAELWRSGAASFTRAALERWVRAHDWKRDDVPLGAAYLEVQGGTFFVRAGEEEFRFAHKSFLEYFLARGLVRELARDPGRALDTAKLTREVIAFAYELVKRAGAARSSAAIEATLAWLSSGRGIDGRGDEVWARAAANAVRLVEGMRRAAGDEAAWIPEGTDLRGVVFDGEELSGVWLEGVDLSGASFARARIDRARLDAAKLAGAMLAGARITDSSLRGVDASGASFVHAEVRGCVLAGSSLARADLSCSAWSENALDGASTDGARATVMVIGRGGRNATTPSLRPTGQFGHHGSVLAIAWSPDGRWVASAGADRTVRIWDPRAARELARLEGHQSDVNSVAWDHDGRRLASASDDKTIRIWDPRAARELARLEGHQSVVTSVAWDHDGRRLASASADNTIRIWDPRAARELARLEGHQSSVSSLAWDHDGRRLASASDDNTIRIWDPRAARELARLEGHQSSVKSVAWDHDGRRLASASYDGTIRIWDTTSWRELACIELSGDSHLIRTRRGFFVVSGNPEVFASIPTPTGSALLAPLGEAREILEDRARVEAVLSGDESADDVDAAFIARGWPAPKPWDGEPMILHDEPARLAPTPPPEPARRTNPFHPGNAPLPNEEPLGRERELEAILDRLADRGSARLIGPRRAGKTWLLAEVAKRASADHHVHHISLERCASRTPGELARSLDPQLANDPTPATTFERALLQAARRPVIIIDEIGRLHDADLSIQPEVFGWLRGLGQSCASILYAGSYGDWARALAHAYRVPGSSFGNDLLTVALGPLASTDAVRLLEERAPSDVPLDRERAIKWTLEFCGTWPFYLQAIGYALIAAARAGDRRALVDRAALQDLYERELLQNRSDLFRGRWDELESRSRELLLARKDAFPSPATLTRADLDALQRDGVYDAMAGWRLADDRPFLDWISRMRSILEKREDP